MPRAYAKLLTTIWSDPDFIALPAHAQRAYMLIISQPDLSLCGVLHIRVRPWSRLASDTPSEAIEEALRTLSDRGFVVIDEDTEELLVRTFIRHDGGVTNRNIHKGIVNSARFIQSRRLQTVAAAELDKAAGNTPSEPPSKPPGTHSEGPSNGHANPSSLQPAPFNSQPAASSRAGPGSELSPELPDAAAAAVEILIAHRTTTARESIDNVDRYARKIRLNLTTDEQRALAAEAGTGAAPDLIARRVFNLTPSQTICALAAIRARGDAAS